MGSAHMTTALTREEAERAERERLSPLAALSSESRGRERPLVPDPLRTEFQRDRDRIIHCKSFRRLSHKTQVFLAAEGDHYRTRLTHTLEVAQIARSVARAMRLNEDLTEAIALAHDLGHTPFGHIGEDALNEALAAVAAGGAYADMPVPFHHNLQSLRVVETLEYEGEGLNLTWELRDGIVRHTGDEPSATMEGRVVAIADRIAYVNHDIDDAIRGGVLTGAQLPREAVRLLGGSHGERITAMVSDMVETSLAAGDVRMSEPVWDAMMSLRAFLFEHVYLSRAAKAEEPKAFNVVKTLFGHYMRNPEELPPEFRPTSPEECPRRVTDYIAGMTDRFAIRDFEAKFVPRKWMV